MRKLFPVINYVVSGKSKSMANAFKQWTFIVNVEIRAQLYLDAHPLVIWMGRICVEQVDVLVDG